MADSATASFEAQLSPVLDRAYAAAWHLTRNAAEAEDLVQEAALLAWRGYHGFLPGSSFRAWFLRILTNKFISDYRRDRRRGVVVDMDAVPEFSLWQHSRASGMHSPDADPAAALTSQLDGEQIAAALDRLPEEYRLAAVLYFVEDLSYQEIADILGVPIGTVRSRLHRGRRLLQAELWALAAASGIVPRNPVTTGDR
ncbi:MAG: sigma-70 family RNA polymerase sigma factor [Gemmatimonadota bacterium]|nr:sigma-70 family RNA polymerase sigma factor [Gemmatimonadota bacterium]